MHEDINETIKAHEGLVYAQLHKFNLAHEPDAISYAFEALYKATKTYNAEMGYKFSTYAMTCIYNALGGYLRDLKRKKQLQVVSYNDIVDKTLNQKTKTEVIDTTIIPPVEAAEDTVISRANIKEIHKILRGMRSMYTGNILRIFDIWYNHHFEISTSDLSKMLGVSQPYVSTQLSRIRNDFRKKWRQYNE